MSYTELHVGTLREVPLNGKSISDVMLNIIQKEDPINYSEELENIKNEPDEEKKFDVVYDSFRNFIDDEHYYLDIDTKKLYKIVDHKSYDDEDYPSEFVMQPNGDIRFVTQFYNGGCSFIEALDYGIKDVVKPKERRKEDSIEDFIGTEIGILDENGKEYKTITVKSVKDTSREKDGSEFCVTDEDGNIYLYDELNLTYCLTTEAILYNAITKEYGTIISWNAERLKRVFKDFIDNMIRSGYIADKE